MEINCRVKHYPTSNGSVEFSLEKYEIKKDQEITTSYGFSLPFEIWKKFKDGNVKITVEKAED